MAARRRRRRTVRRSHNPRRRRRRRTYARATFSNPRRRARRHNPRRRRRSRRRSYSHNPRLFGGGLFKGIPSGTTIAFGALGLVAAPLLVTRLAGKDATGKSRIPGGIAGNVVIALAGTIIGGLVGKFFRPAAGAAFVTGAVIGQAGVALKESGLLSRIPGFAPVGFGYYDDEGLLDGATYTEVAGATYTDVSGIGNDGLAELDMLGQSDDSEYMEYVNEAA